MSPDVKLHSASFGTFRFSVLLVLVTIDNIHIFSPLWFCNNGFVNNTRNFDKLQKASGEIVVNTIMYEYVKE
jgi:hypothetical protein